MMTMLREETLENGLRLVFEDQSNRYFGDYHRICVVTSICCDLQTLTSDEDSDLLARARQKFGDTLTITKHFEKMGVAGDDVERVRETIVEDFLKHAASYLARPEYPISLVKAELNRKPVAKYYV
jgi:hypothetical protein